MMLLEQTGIKEISEQKGNMLVHFSNITSKEVSKLCSVMGGRAFINVGAKPHVLVKKQKEATSINTLKDILDAITC